jgi:hypothetical protein
MVHQEEAAIETARLVVRPLGRDDVAGLVIEAPLTG